MCSLKQIFFPPRIFFWCGAAIFFPELKSRRLTFSSAVSLFKFGNGRNFCPAVEPFSACLWSSALEACLKRMLWHLRLSRPCGKLKSAAGFHGKARLPCCREARLLQFAQWLWQSFLTRWLIGLPMPCHWLPISTPKSQKCRGVC